MNKLIVDVERMAPEGTALAKAPGSSRVVFVPYGVPGDRLEIEQVETKSSYARGRLLRVVSPGADRVKPPCPLHFDPSRAALSCGGCDWQQLAYEAQLKNKRLIVQDCVARIGKMRDVPIAETIPSPQPWAYRNKVQIPFGFDGKTSRVVAGFYAPGSHTIVDFEACPVQPDLSVRLALKVKEMAVAERWPVYDALKHRGWLRHLFVRTSADGRALAALVTRSPDFPRQDRFVETLRAAFPEIVSLPGACTISVL